MQEDRFTIRTMTRKEVEIAVEWAAQEGWNPGLHDAACYFTADPAGFFIGLLGDEAVATLSAVRYGESFGFMGFYIVKPEHRGRGYGIRIGNAGLDHLQGRSIGLDGVVAQQENYKKSGFEPAYRNIRYEGVGGGELPEPSEIVELSALPFQAVRAYDKPFFPADRSRFLRAWVNQPDARALGIVRKGELAGYGVLRPCRRGCKIGPLFADGPEPAESLFLALKSKVDPAEPVFLDTPEVNRAAVALAERHRMKVVFETARMYRGEAPRMPLDRIFGVTSFEVG